MYIIDDETRRFGRMLHYAGLLTTVVCAAAGYSLVHAPTIQAVADTTARIEELRLSVQNAPVAREQHQNVSARLREVKTGIAAVQRRVPQDANSGEFLKAITQLASSAGLTIKDFQPDQPESRAGYGEMQVTLKGAGSYASICTFLDELSKLTRLSKVMNLTLSASDGSDQYPMTATLVVYFGLQGKDIVEGPSPAVRGALDPTRGGAAGPIARGSPGSAREAALKPLKTNVITQRGRRG